MGGWDIWSMMTGISLLVGGFNPSEKYESQLGSLFHIIPIYYENKSHVPNQQPVYHVELCDIFHFMMIL